MAAMRARVAARACAMALRFRTGRNRTGLTTGGAALHTSGTDPARRQSQDATCKACGRPLAPCMTTMPHLAQGRCDDARLRQCIVAKTGIEPAPSSTQSSRATVAPLRETPTRAGCVTAGRDMRPVERSGIEPICTAVPRMRSATPQHKTLYNAQGQGSIKVPFHGRLPRPLDSRRSTHV
jgi:hypothetical protein